MKKLFKLLPPGVISVLATAFVIYMSLASNPLDLEDIPMFPGSDKIAHIILDCALSMVYMIDYANSIYPHHLKFNRALALCAAAFVFGVLMEAAQGFMDMGRTTDINDGFANLGGVVLAFILTKWVVMKWYRNVMRHKSHHHHHDTMSENADE